MPSRRSVLLALGGLATGGGALLGTGAFTTVAAERSVALETADDADAFLGFEVLDDEHVDLNDGVIAFDLLARATTRYGRLIDVRNNGTQAVRSLRFEFDVAGADQDDDDVENALKVVSGDATIDAVDDANLLVVSSEGGADDDVLDPGEAVPFGIAVDLTGNIHEITGDPDTTLTIIADTDRGGGDGSDGDEEDDGDPGSGSPPDGRITIVSVERGNDNGNGNGNDNGNRNDLTVTVEVTTDANNAKVEIRTQGNSGPKFGVESGTNQYSKNIGAGNAENVKATLLDGEGNEIATDTEEIDG